MIADSDCAKIADRRRFRKIHLSLLLFMMIALVLLAIGLLPTAVWDGRFDLTLDVSSLSGKHIKNVSYATYFRQDEADWVATDSSEVSSHALRPVARDTDGFIVPIPCSGKANYFFDIEWSYSEACYIVVEVTDEKGEKTRKSLHIPKGRGPRSMTVLVP